jgi:hypothetical protein
MEDLHRLSADFIILGNCKDGPSNRIPSTLRLSSSRQWTFLDWRAKMMLRLTPILKAGHS